MVPPVRFQARQCSRDSCGLRFPVDADSELGRVCPLCQSVTVEVGQRYATDGAQAESCEQPAHPLRIVAILDNVRSLRNVGAIFRCSDGAGVDHLYLCGFTPTPKHPKLAKTALGAEQSVAWSRHANAMTLVESLRDEGYQLCAIEGGADAQSLFDPSMLASVQTSKDSATPFKLALVFGHEVSGVDPAILKHCVRKIKIPMLGQKGSLNVSVAFGIVAFTLRFLGATSNPNSAISKSRGDT